MKNKNRIVSFLMGVAAALVLGSLSLPALAESGVLNITASPISVIVNGEEFQPKDANGNDALVFVYNGTTTETPVTNYGSEKIFNAKYSGPMSKAEFTAWWKSMDLTAIRAEAEKMAAETREPVPGYEVTKFSCAV